MSCELHHAFADLGDVTLHYVTAGQGPAVVLLHGWPQTWFMWRDIIPGLAEHYRVIAPDLRGLGDFSRPVAGYEKKSLAHDVWRLAHDVLGEKQLLVVGHDWGGRRHSRSPHNIAMPCAAWRSSMHRYLVTGHRSCSITGGITACTGSSISLRH